MTFLREVTFLFVIYSFIGWIIEGLFNLYTKGHFSKPNFLKLPLKPMYGFASTILILLYARLPIGYFLLFVLIVPTTIEYLSATFLANCFDLHYWNYQHKPYQLHGYICLQFSCYWVILSLLLLFFLQPLIAIFYTLLLPLWEWVCPIISFIIIIDFIQTILKYHPLKKTSV